MCTDERCRHSYACTCAECGEPYPCTVQRNRASHRGDVVAQHTAKLSEDAKKRLDDMVEDAWNAIGHDLSEAAGACDEDTIHVDDLAEVIMNYLRCEHQLADSDRERAQTHRSDLYRFTTFEDVIASVKRRLSNGRSRVSF